MANDKFAFIAGLLGTVCLTVPLTGQTAETEPTTAPQSLVQAISSARKFGQLPAGPARGYKFSGTIAFNFPNADVVTRDYESWVGGHGRLRYRLGNKTDAHIFLLTNPQTAWLKRQKTDTFTKTENRELSVQNWMRWTICTLPRGLETILKNFSSDTQQCKLSSPFGTFTLEFNESALPSKLIHHELELTISDWQTAASGELMPRTWAWKTEFGTQVEKIEHVDEQILLYDRSFYPPRKDSDLAVAHSHWEGTGSSFAGEEFGIFKMPEVELVLLSGIKEERRQLRLQDAIGNSEWRLVEQARLPGPYAIVHKPELLPQDAFTTTFKAGHYLRWVTLADNDFADDHRAFLNIARENGLKEIGTVRATGFKKNPRNGRRELLVPITVE